MPVKGTEFTVYLDVYNSTTGARITGDAANLTLTVNGIAATNSPSNAGNRHALVVTAAEANADAVSVDGTSSTSNAVVVAQTIYTGAAMRGTDGAYTGTPPAASTIATAVWAESSRTLTSFGTLVADTATAVWSVLTSALTVTGSIGAWIVAKLDAAVSTVGGTLLLAAAGGQITVDASGEGVGGTGALTLVRGTSVTFAFTATGKTLTGHSLYCTARRTREDVTDATDTTAVFSKACVVTAATTFSLTLTPTETDKCDLGTAYWYEIRDVTAGDSLIVARLEVVGSVVKRTS
jgi:hypothetical protein